MACVDLDGYSAVTCLKYGLRNGNKINYREVNAKKLQQRNSLVGRQGSHAPLGYIFLTYIFVILKMS